jgi:hypothetical protein
MQTQPIMHHHQHVRFERINNELYCCVEIEETRISFTCQLFSQPVDEQNMKFAKRIPTLRRYLMNLGLQFVEVK